MSERTDEELVAAAVGGERAALEALVRRHEPWVFNLALRMVWRRDVAEDATQEILLKLVTRLGSYERRARFRTWAYRVAVNHLLDVKKSEMERQGVTFADLARSIDDTVDEALPDPRSVPVELPLLVEEAKQGCLHAMLMCLDRRQRLAFVLGAVLAVEGEVAAEVLDLSHEAYRQLLTRARRDLASFMDRKCGLVNADNPCRCARKTAGFVKAGYVDPARRQFTLDHRRRVAEVVGHGELPGEAIERAAVALHRGLPWYESTRSADALRRLLDEPVVRRALDPAG